MIIELESNRIAEEQLEQVFPTYLHKGEIAQTIKMNPFIRYCYYVQDEKIVGLLMYTIAYQKMELVQIAVVEAFQNQKIASHMMEYLCEVAVQQKAQNITLEVRANNESALHLYEKYGFINVALRPGYYHGIDGILMEKEMIK